MKHVHVYIFLLISIFHPSCGQNHPNAPQDHVKSGLLPGMGLAFMMEKHLPF